MATRMEIGPYSAYAIAAAAGFKGSEEEWLASLLGRRGRRVIPARRAPKAPRA